MWILTIAELFNAMAHQNDVINNLRLPVGGMPVGVMELFAAVLFLYAVLAGANLSRMYPSERMHPAFVLALALLSISIVTGTIESLLGQVSLEYYLKMVRELGVWPLYLFVGYRLMATPRSASYFIWVILIGGIGIATMLILHFSSNTETIEIKDGYNSVRTVWYISFYAGLSAMVLAYGLVTGEKYLPTIIAAPLVCYLLVGQFAPLHRVEWMGIFFCFCGLVVLVPKGKRLGTAIKGALFLVGVLALALMTIKLVSSVTQRDFGAFVNERLESLLPTERKSSKDSKAWDTRVDSIGAELGIWAENPLLGKGFGIQEERVITGKMTNYGAFHHNGWCSVLAQTGIVGLSGFAIVLVGTFVMGRRVAMNAPTRGMRLLGVMAVMSSLYEFAEVLGAMAWTTRFAMLSGVICGMVFRCHDMMEAVAVEQKMLGIPDHYEHEHEDAPQGVEHAPLGF